MRAVGHKAFQLANVRVPSPAAIEKGPVLRAGPEVPMRLTAPSRGDIRYHGQRRAPSG